MTAASQNSRKCNSPCSWAGTSCHRTLVCSLVTSMSVHVCHHLPRPPGGLIVPSQLSPILRSDFHLFSNHLVEFTAAFQSPQGYHRLLARTPSLFIFNSFLFSTQCSDSCSFSPKNYLGCFTMDSKYRARSDFEWPIGYLTHGCMTHSKCRKMRQVLW